MIERRAFDVFAISRGRGLKRFLLCSSALLFFDPFLPCSISSYLSRALRARWQIGERWVLLRNLPSARVPLA